MRNLKTILIFTLLFFSLSGVVLSAPLYTPLRSIVPETNNIYYVGTTSPYRLWANGYFQGLTIANGSATTTLTPGMTFTTVPDLTQLTVSGSKYYTASTTGTTNLSWYFKNGFLSTASSTISSDLKIDGQLSIGSSSPPTGYKLVVAGDTYIYDSSGGGYLFLGDRTQSGYENQFQYINFGGSANGTDYGWQLGKVDNANPDIAPDKGFYIFDVKNNLTRFVIDSNGNIGIGTTSPGKTLSVAGEGLFSGMVTAPFFNATNTTASSTFQDTETTELKIGTLSGLLRGTSGYINSTTLTDADVPDDITASNYLALSAWFGTTTIPHITTALGLTNASSTQLTVNKQWVTGEICFSNGRCMSSPSITGTAVTLFHWNSAAEFAGYENLFTTSPNGTEVDESCTANSGTAGGYCDVEAGGYISTTTQLVLDSVPSGEWLFRKYTYVDNVSGDSKLESNVYKRTALGVETYLFQATSSDINSTSVVLRDYSTTASAYTFSPTDRIVIKLRGWTDSGTNKVIHMLYNSSQRYSRIITPITVANFGYAQKSSNETITGNWTMGSTTIYISTAGTIVATSTLYAKEATLVNASTSLLSISDKGYITNRLGIGTTTPGTALSVTGAGVFTDQVTAPFFTATNTAASTTLQGAIVKLGLQLSDKTTCTLKTDGSGYVYCGTDNNSGSDGFNFTQSTWGGVNTSATSTLMDFVAGFHSGSSSISYLTVGSFLATSTTASSTISHGLEVTEGVKAKFFEGTSATSTSANGWNIAAGCYAINGTCVSGGTVANTSFYPAFSYSTSTAWLGTTTPSYNLGPSWGAETWNQIKCHVSGGALASTSVSIKDAGGNRMDYFVASGTIGTITLTQNNSFTAGEGRFVDIGNPQNSPTSIGCTVYKTITLATDYFTFSKGHASTSWTSTSTVDLGPAWQAQTFNQMRCNVPTGTLNVQLGDGTNWTSLQNASSTIGLITFASNNTFTAGEARYLRMGTPATSPTSGTCTFYANK